MLLELGGRGDAEKLYKRNERQKSVSRSSFSDKFEMKKQGGGR
jgi:hypothetical protein